MKKSIFIVTLVLVFSFVFSISSLANYDNIAEISDDYSTLYLNGESYSRADIDSVNLDVYAEGEIFTSGFGSENNYTTYYIENIKIELTDSQKAELTKAYVRTMGEAQLFATAELYYKDGTTIWYSFVRDDVKEDFDKIKNNKAQEYVISFYDYMNDEDILKSVSKKNLLTGKMAPIPYYEYQEFDVVVYSEKYDYSVYKGFIYANDNSYYYFDFEENGLTNNYDLYNMNNITEIEVHKITDEETIAILEEGLQEYYDDDYGYLFNDKLTDTVAKIFFTFAFAIVPLAVFVITLILSIKSKKALYKKLLLATSVLSLATIGTFIYLAFLLFNK